MWGLGVKWYTLGFIPFLSILVYFQNKKEKISLRLVKSAFIICIGFGFFVFLMILPYMLRGDLSILKQIMEFRLKILGGGGEVSTLYSFSEEGTFWRIFQDTAGIRPMPNFFLLTFLPIYLASLVGFFVLLKKSSSNKNIPLPVFNNALILTLFIYFVTYPRMNPQTFLWVLPHLILGCYLFDQIGVLPIVIISIVGTIDIIDFFYFTVGFGIYGIVPAWLGSSLHFVFSVSIVPIAFYFILKQLSPTLNSKIIVVCKNLLGRFRIKFYILYILITIFIFLEASLIYYFNMYNPFLLPLLISSILIQSIAFFSIMKKVKGNECNHI